MTVSVTKGMGRAEVGFGGVCWGCWRDVFWEPFWYWNGEEVVVVVRLRIAVREVVYFVALGRRARRVVRARDSIVVL